MPPIALVATVTATTPDRATLLDSEMDAATEAVSAVMVDTSDRVTETAPPAETVESAISASIWLVVMLLATAPEPAPDRATVPLLALNEKDTATPAVVMVFVAVACTVTSLPAPAAVTVESAIAARLSPEMVFSATDTATDRPTPAIPPETATETDAATTLALIEAVSVSVTVTSPSAVRELPVMSASVDPEMAFVAVATARAAEIDAELPTVTEIATPTEMASMSLPLVAVTLTAPPASTLEFSMPASTSLEMLFEASAMAADIARVTDDLRADEVEQIVSDAGELADRLNRASVRVDGILAKVDELLGSGEAEGVITQASETLRGFQQVADTLNSRLGTITEGLARFSGQGLRDVEALVRDGNRYMTISHNAQRKVIRDFDRSLWIQRIEKCYLSMINKREEASNG